MVVLVTDEDAFACAAHAMSIVVFFESLKSGDDRGVLLRLRLFNAEGVVGEGIQAYGGRLVRVEG